MHWLTILMNRGKLLKKFLMSGFVFPPPHARTLLGAAILSMETTQDTREYRWIYACAS